MAILPLAEDFFKEGNWAGCRTECFRVLSSAPDNQEALLLKAMSESRMEIDSSAALKNLCDSPDTRPEIRYKAHYELGRLLWKLKLLKPAFEHFLIVFHSAEASDLFLKSGCSLALIIEESPDIPGISPALLNELKTCSHLWSRQILAECKPVKQEPRSALTGKPGQWLISFYRAQIAPAIGQRCTLHPSCSEYARQAFRKHGILGFAIFGDRAVREPDVAAEKEHSVKINKQWRYADPLEDHDWWIQK